MTHTNTRPAAPNAGPEPLTGLILKQGDLLAVPGAVDRPITGVTQDRPNRHLVALGDEATGLIVRTNGIPRRSDLLGGLSLQLLDTVETPEVGERMLGAIERVRQGRYRLRLDRKNAAPVWVEMLSAEARAQQARQQSRRRGES